jgi:hypothetical protein
VHTPALLRLPFHWLSRFGLIGSSKKWLGNQAIDFSSDLQLRERLQATSDFLKGVAVRLNEGVGHVTEITNWQDAADDVYTYLHERKRTFTPKAMLAVIDDLAVHGSVTKDDMVARHGTDDFISTTLGHVTTALHGKGPVPSGGWYSTTKNPHTYVIHPDFAEAWKKKRRLQG